MQVRPVGSGTGGLPLVVWYVTPQGVNSGRGWWSECESPMKEMVRSVDSVWAGLHLKSTLQSDLPTLPGNRLTLGGAVLLGSARPQISKHRA